MSADIRTDKPQVDMTGSIPEIEQRYWLARNDLKKAVLLIRLSGPDELIVAAKAVSDTDLALRRLWFDREPDAREARSPKISAALHANSQALEGLADLARQITAVPR